MFVWSTFFFYMCTLNAIEVIDIIWPFKWFSFSKPYMIIPSQFFLQNLWTLQRTGNGGTGQWVKFRNRLLCFCVVLGSWFECVGKFTTVWYKTGNTEDCLQIKQQTLKTVSRIFLSFLFVHLHRSHSMTVGSTWWTCDWLWLFLTEQLLFIWG